MVAKVGVRTSENKTKEKKITPVMSKTVGVMRAAIPQPNLLKIQRETSIIVKVTAPVAVEKSPMKAE